MPYARLSEQELMIRFSASHLTVILVTMGELLLATNYEGNDEACKGVTTVESCCRNTQLR
ncbi:hypothetical protein DPMN_129650 [Dreissena polymorpha]|uniref:Uncharacterized protein n=1 Tax=Dreissena polymorpha TaxID=45954 RepID=A0A9D4H1J7_DREPO|nr:hypothetical protein DPMN_129650 [Dreissena polymorpha]